MTVQEFYDSIGSKCDEVVKRFGGSMAMLEKFLKKFPADPTFGQLEEAMASGDAELIFRAAHTLKGLAGNFDFGELFELSESMVREYRAGNHAALAPLFEKLKPVYLDVKTKIETMFA